MHSSMYFHRYVLNPQKLCNYNLISVIMFWVIQVMIVSFVIIFILHNLYFFFKETLTIPKMKDMVKRPQQRYDTLFRELRMHNEEHSNNAADTTASAAASARDGNADAMKNELKRYLMELNAPSEPQSQSLSNSNFIELGSAYQ